MSQPQTEHIRCLRRASNAFASVNLNTETPPGTLGSGQVNLLTALSETGSINFFDVTGADGKLTLSQLGIVDPVTGMPYAPEIFPIECRADNRTRLQTRAVARKDYLPILFDFEKPPNRSTIEAVSILAKMARIKRRRPIFKTASSFSI